MPTSKPGPKRPAVSASASGDAGVCRSPAAAAEGLAAKPRTFTLHDLVDVLFALQGRDPASVWEVEREALHCRVRSAVLSGALVMRHPETLLSETFAEWPDPSASALVCTDADVDAWLHGDRAPYRLADARAIQPVGGVAGGPPVHPGNHSSEHRQKLLRAALKQLCIDPRTLVEQIDPAQRGKPGARARVKKQLGAPAPPWDGEKFKHAWDKLLKELKPKAK